MESDELLDKVIFVKDTFKSKGLSAYLVEGDGMNETTIFRKDDSSSLFLLLSVSNHFQDPGWGVNLSVGDGFPEKSQDPVEVSFASVSLAELGKYSANVSNLSYEVNVDELRELLADGIKYCLQFISGDVEFALKVRKSRNTKKSIDPLNLDLQDDWMKEEYKERNDELRVILNNYL